MGLFTSIRKTRKCDRCQVSYEEDYQFKTGHHDFMEVFKDGQKRPKGFPEGKWQLSYHCVCGDCHRVIGDLHDGIVKRTADVVARLLPAESRLTYDPQDRWGTGKVVLGKKTLFTWTRHNGIFRASHPISKEWGRLREEIIAFWKRQMKSAGVTWEMKVIHEKSEDFFSKVPMDTLHLLSPDVSAQDAIVVVDKKMKIVEPHDLLEDPNDKSTTDIKRKWFMVAGRRRK